jgi:hypothetical protein
MVPLMVNTLLENRVNVNPNASIIVCMLIQVYLD